MRNLSICFANYHRCRRYLQPHSSHKIMINDKLKTSIMKCMAKISLQKLAIALCWILFAGVPVMAQVRSRTITGSVNDQAGDIILGATITVKGGVIGTTSDSAGKFKITVPVKAKTLVISYVGMVDKEVDIADQSTVNVSLNSV